MPLKSADNGHVDEDPISGSKAELWLPPYDELRDFGREEDAGDDVCLPRSGLPEHEGLAKEEEKPGCQNPLPKVMAMKDEEKEEEGIEEMRPVKHLNGIIF